ncbi:MAG: hypothetical protein ABW217_20330 [Polyangiaceae bacterium]
MTMPDDFKFDSRIRQRMLRRGDLTPAELTAHVEGLPDLQDEHEVMDDFTQPALSPARADALDPSPAFDPLRRVGIGSSAYVAAKVPSPSLAAKPLPRPLTPIAQGQSVVRPAPASTKELDSGFVRSLSPRSDSSASELASAAAERAHRSWNGIDVPTDNETTHGSTLRSEPVAARPEPIVVKPEPVLAQPPAKEEEKEEDEDEDEDEDDDDDDDDDDVDSDEETEGGDADEDDVDDDDDDEDEEKVKDDDEEPPTNPRGAQ